MMTHMSQSDSNEHLGVRQESTHGSPIWLVIHVHAHIYKRHQSWQLLIAPDGFPAYLRCPVIMVNKHARRKHRQDTMRDSLNNEHIAIYIYTHIHTHNNIQHVHTQSLHWHHHHRRHSMECNVCVRANVLWLLRAPVCVYIYTPSKHFFTARFTVNLYILSDPRKLTGQLIFRVVGLKWAKLGVLG